MKLYKALKLKNKITGEISKIKQKIQSHNSYPDGSKHYFQINDLLAELKKKIMDLGNLKMQIYRANLPIQNLIFELSEQKSMITFLSGLDVKEGEQAIGYSSEKTRNYTATITEKERDEMIVAHQKEIDEIQESLDTFNHTTEIDFEE